jgi:molybdopterin synthase sulfur carrier subunit
MDGRADSPAIRVRLFAGLREQAGWSERECRPLQAPAKPAGIWAQLQLPGDPSQVRVAINHRFAALDSPLEDGDELAFLPPISGG